MASKKDPSTPSKPTPLEFAERVVNGLFRDLGALRDFKETVENDYKDEEK